MSDESRSEEASANFQMRACKIDRARLDRILEVATKDLSKPPRTTLSTKRKGSGITSTITGDTVGDLLRNVKRSTLPGNPDAIDNLTAYFHVFGAGSFGERIYIRVKDSEFMPHVSVSVKGSDPGWVVGRTSQLKDLFAETQAPQAKYLRISGWRITLPLLGVVLSFGIVPLLSSTRTFSGRTAGQIVLGLGVLFFLAGVGYLLGSWLDRMMDTEIHLTGMPVHRPRDWVNIGVLIVTIIGVLVGIAAIFIAHSDASRDHSTGGFAATHSSYIQESPKPPLLPRRRQNRVSDQWV